MAVVKHLKPPEFQYASNWAPGTDSILQKDPVALWLVSTTFLASAS